MPSTPTEPLLQRMPAGSQLDRFGMARLRLGTCPSALLPSNSEQPLVDSATWMIGGMCLQVSSQPSSAGLPTPVDAPSAACNSPATTNETPPRASTTLFMRHTTAPHNCATQRGPPLSFCSPHVGLFHTQLSKPKFGCFQRTAPPTL